MFTSAKSLRKILSCITCAALTLLAACGGAGGVSTMRNHPNNRIVIPNPSAPSVAAEPGAILVCPSSGKNAWLTYGQNAFFAISESIENLEATAPITKGDVASFLIYLYGGPAQITYTDGVIYKAHASFHDDVSVRLFYFEHHRSRIGFERSFHRRHQRVFRSRTHLSGINGDAVPECPKQSGSAPIV
jgi:hypothetical protein